MSRYETVDVRVQGAAATIVLDRPEVMNAWNRQLTSDLKAAVDGVSTNDDIRAVCITGAGTTFSAGGDLKELSVSDDVTANGRPDVYRSLVERVHPIIIAVRTIPKPVVAAVNGVAAGVGLSLALAADFIVAKASAQLGMAFIKIGVVPDGGSLRFVQERIGLTRANELAMLGDPLAAPEAANWGLITKAVPDSAFEAEVDALMRRLAMGPTAAYAATKRILNASLLERLDVELELEACLQSELVASDDYLEGVNAFLEKRDACFRGH